MRNGTGWNVTMSKGIVVGYLCPDCQTAEENTEAVINEAGIDYSAGHVDAAGRYWAPSK
ncbi:MAG: hypothetical protein ACR2KJ_00605 [Jatrophihabitans sp.]